MKRLSFIIALLMSSILYAQNDFQGEIVYEYSYEDVAAQIKPQIAMAPTSSTIEIRDGISKTTTPNAMGGETIILYEKSSGDIITLLNMMGMKYGIKSNAKEAEAEMKEEDKPEITYVEGEKEILGYKCKKAISEQNGNEVEIFYTEELKDLSELNSTENSVKGFPLEIKLMSDNFTRIQKVKSIEEKKVKKIKMQIPGDYEETTMEELQQKMGGM